MSSARRSIARGLLLLSLAGCATRSPRLVIGPGAADLDVLLAARPLAATQEIRVDEIGRSESASYHLVQVVGSERPHRHRVHDLSVLVLRGEGTLTLGDTQVRLRAGDAAVVPRGRSHWFRNDGDEPSVAFAIFTPPLDAPDNVPDEAR
jgi:quercetin dioxygenase-like cupin family protein